MPGGYYTALSGMRTRLDQFDRLAADIANAGTAGYKSERWSHAQSDRPQFGPMLQTAIDVTSGERRLSTVAGAITPTGRPLDAAIDGNGFFVVETAGGATRFTRNGHFVARPDGVLTTEDGSVVQGASGPINVGTGQVSMTEDGTVFSNGTVAGKLQLVAFDHPGTLVREGASLLRSDVDMPHPATDVAVRSGSLEQSNVSVVERIAELTDVTRTFEALQKALSLQMNDLDGRAIEVLGRR